MSTSKFHEGLFLKVFQKMCHVFQRKTRVVRWMFVCLSVPLSPWLSFSLSHTQTLTHTHTHTLSLSLCWRRRNARQVKTETKITVILLASNHQNHFRSLSFSFSLSPPLKRTHTLSHPVYCFKSAATLGKKGTDIPMSRRRPFDLNLKNAFYNLHFTSYK